MRWLVRAIEVFVMAALIFAPIGARAASIDAANWTSYKNAFLDPVGRIVDTGNNNISHSEGQGYGMWLAVLADNRADFELIWSFTKTELLVRDDGLAAWKWDPQADPHISDINNATDGDLLIAYALALAAKQWQRQDYAESAAAIASTIAKKAIVKVGGRTLLLPAVSGFGVSDREDGPVVNPSYLIFEAFPLMNELAPSPVWQAVATHGVAQITSFGFGPRKLPADWVSVKTKPRSADGFPAEFGYNALRIPLYLARAQAGNAALYNRFLDGISVDGGNIATFDLGTGQPKDILSDPGYRMIAALTKCAASGAKIPDDLRTFQPTLYYPSTLHLLALSFVMQSHGECL